MHGRWKFYFEHTVTKRRVNFETHGIDNIQAYCDAQILGFSPKVYWNGSSSEIVEIEDFAAPGFRVLQTFEAT